MKRLIALFLAFFIQLPTFAADSGLLVRNGFSGLTPTANQTWAFNTADLKLYGYDGTNWQQQTPGRIQPAGIGAPTSSTDSTQGYSIGSLWFDSSGLNWYICTSNTASAAVWNIFTNRVAQTDINNSIQPKSTFADTHADFVVSGLLAAVPGSSLTMTTPTGTAYVTGLRVIPTSSTFTYTASKDTYDYLQTSGSINHVAVTNGASAPTGQTGLALQKVVTGSVVTSVTQLAPTASATNVGTAVASTQNAINITQADARYQSQSSLIGSANQFAATPNGANGAVALRNILSADLPLIGVAQGGTGANLTPTVNSLLAGNGSVFTTVPPPSSGLQYVRSNAGNTALEFAAATGIGTIAITDGSGLYTYSPSPLTTSGTITGSLATQAINTALHGPASGSAAAPTFRLMTPGDIQGGAYFNNLCLYTVAGSPYADSSGATSTLKVGGRQCNTQSFYDGTANFYAENVPETTVTMSGNTANIPVDVYVKGGGAGTNTVTVSQTAWTNATTPPTRGADPAGRLTKNGDTSQLFVGAYNPTSATQTRDDIAERFVSSVYQTIKKRLYALDTTANYSTSSNTFTTANGSTVDGVGAFSYLQCIANTPVNARFLLTVYWSGASGAAAIGLGFNSTSVASFAAGGTQGATSLNIYIPVTCPGTFAATLGVNKIQKLVVSGGAYSVSFYETITGLSGSIAGSAPIGYMEGEVQN